MSSSSRVPYLPGERGVRGSSARVCARDFENDSDNDQADKRANKKLKTESVLFGSVKM